MQQIHIEAVTENLSNVTSFVEEILEARACSMKASMQILVALEEMYVNVCHYAYGDKTGYVDIAVEFEDDNTVSITLKDEGIPYNPLEKSDPDISLPLDERPIGGLGIFMVKKSMDHVAYEHVDGCNVFTMTKSW
ncbi:MAG: ATP-binding protein [Lachnospiraceae bacterium]|nr:ATP-binding protein [Lachnospiraceae bacterium]